MGFESTIEYNHLSQVTRSTNVEGIETRATYDLLGNVLTSAVEDVSAQIKDSVAYEYDGMLRNIRADWTDGEFIATSYDENYKGKVDVVSRNNSSETYTYDALARLNTVTSAITGQSNTLNFTKTYNYNSDGVLERLDLPGGGQLNYGYDGFKRLNNLFFSKENQENKTIVSAVNYTPNSKVASWQYGNSLTKRFEYDQFRPLLESFYLEDAQGNEIHNMNFTYDNVGNIQTLRRTNNELLNFSYDRLYRLKHIVYPAGVEGGTQTFNYDLNGNRQQWYHDFGQVEHFYDSTDGKQDNNLVQSVRDNIRGFRSFNYDQRGNISEVGFFPGEALVNEYRRDSYEYNPLNQLTFYTKSENNEEGVSPKESKWAYAYDVAGKKSLTEKQNSQGEWQLEKTYIYEGNNVIAEQFDGGWKWYVPWLNSHIAEVAYFEANDSLCVHYIHTDHLGSVTALSDSLGEIVAKYSIDPWGNVESYCVFRRIRHPFPCASGRSFHEHSAPIGAKRRKVSY